jgi:amino-acid N-acetyltransferase
MLSGKAWKKVEITKATVHDATSIHSLINKFAKNDKMLPRSLNEIYEGIRNFYVYRDGGKIIAISALHVVWEDLAEIRSIAVLKKYQNLGIGKKLIVRCLQEAGELGVKKVFVLTYNPGYFKKIGFKDIDKNTLPHKIWGDCLKCPKFPECEEVAVIKTIK